MIRTIYILALFLFCHISSHAQVADTAKFMKMKIHKSNCLFSYIKKGYVMQNELSDIDPDPSSCMTDTGRVVSYSLTIQKSQYVEEYTRSGGYVEIWPDLVKLPKDGIIYIENIVFRKKDGTTKTMPTVKLTVE